MKPLARCACLVVAALVSGLVAAQEPPRLSISSPAKDAIWFGKTEIRLEVQGLAADALHSLEVYLDGRLLREFSKPPYAFHHDFGKVPRNSVLKAILRVNNQVVADAQIRSMAIDDIQEVEVTQVLVPVVVSDANGNYVTHLTKEDFILLEDGRPQRISNFSRSGTTRFHLALLIDVSSSMKDRIGAVKAAARKFLEELLGRNDRAMVVFFNHDVFEGGDFTNDLDELSNSIATAFPFGATALYDAVGHCLKMFSGMSGLNIVIILSDGEDNSSYLDPYTLTRKAERSNVVIYSIGRRFTSYNDEYQMILKNLSAASGGMLFFIDDEEEIRKVYETIHRDIKAEYVLEYSPDKSGRDKRYRQITVRLKGRKKYVVRTIKGYYF
ncbi:MAG: VWA domain-containing protein [Candidatus Aminicenantes bacterium]|nr:VWA domain-containing protein [Candidatus Aminicenantes bacterium]